MAPRSPAPCPPAFQYAGPASAETPLPMSRHETSPTTVQPTSNHRPNACCFCWCCCCSCSWYVPPPALARGCRGAGEHHPPASPSDIQGSRKQGRCEGRPRVAGPPCFVWHQALGHGCCLSRHPGSREMASRSSPHPWVLCSPSVQLAVLTSSGCGRAAGMEPAPLTEPSLRAACVLALGWEWRAKWVPRFERV